MQTHERMERLLPKTPIQKKRRGTLVNNPLDLSKYVGDYVNKAIVNLFIGAMVILVMWTMSEANFDFSSHKVYTCPENIYNQSCRILIGCEEEQDNPFCKPTQEIVLAPGQRYGEEPNAAVGSFTTNLALLLTVAFTANHALWLYKRNKL